MRARTPRMAVCGVLGVIALSAAACSSGPSTPQVASLGGGTTTTIAAAGSSNILPNPETMDNDQIAYAGCMRSHGLPGFPDPTFSGGGGGPRQAVGGSFDVSKAMRDSPQYGPANDACKHLLPFDGGFPDASERAIIGADLLKYSECMRSHGVPGFPDPIISAHAIGFRLSRGTNPNSPAFASAQRKCQKLPGAP